MEKTQTGSNEDGLYVAAGGGGSGGRERKEDLQIHGGTGWMRKSNCKGWLKKYTSSLNTLTCIKPDPPRAVFLPKWPLPPPSRHSE